MAQSTSIFEHPDFRSVLAPQPYAEGVIFGVAAAPEIPMPEEWMPWIIEQRGDHNVTKQQANILADGLMKGLRDALDAMRKQKMLLPDYCQWASGTLDTQVCSQWLTGVLTAHQQLENVWQRAWQTAGAQELSGEALGERLTRCLKLFSTLAEPVQAIKRATPEHRKSLEEGIPQLALSLPGMLQEYVKISGELAGHLPNQFETFQS